MMLRNIILILITTILSASCTKKKSDTFVYCSEGSPSAFNPQVITDGTSLNASAYPIYNRLTEFKTGTTEIIPGIAESWELSDDNLNYTFNLRKGVKFHTTKYFTPTRELNADDVIFSIDRQMNKANPYHLVSGGTYEYFKGLDMHKDIKNIKKLDSHKIQITLTEPNGPFLANLAMGFMSILSKEYADTLITQNKKDNLDNYPVGTGPFIFKKYVKDSMIRYTGNEEYFLGAPKIKKLVFSITPDASVRLQKLKTKECHFIYNPSPADIDSIKSNSELLLLEQAGLNVAYLAMNMNKRPFDNIGVRTAISYALDKKSYINAIYMGHAMDAKNPIPPTMWGYNSKTIPLFQNIKLAKEILAKSGYPNGFKTELWTLPVNRPYNPNGKKMGEMMQADLKKIGIEAKLVSYDWPTYLDKSRNGEHSMIQMGWTGDNGDPDNFLYTLLSCSAIKSGSNLARWCHPLFDKLIRTAKKFHKQDDRVLLYQRAQEIFRKKLPWIPLVHSKTFKAMQKNVKGYIMDPLGGDIFTNVELVNE